jgi:adenosylcobyric acid synthase
MTQVIMIQGTSSNVGKSILVAALCRIFKQDGYKVAPFKAQNMALNAFVTKEGGEIGRAQAVQSEAAGIEPSVHMNPVLIKPEADSRSQIVLQGKAIGNTSATDYYKQTPKLLEKVRESFEHLSSLYDIIVIEGAGSPAEINLKPREIANMRIARLTKAPVILIGDIDRGGVFASLVGTMELLDEEERHFVKGFILNKFRGQSSLLKPAVDFLEERTEKPLLGIVPYFRDIIIAQEDSVFLDEGGWRHSASGLDIAIIRLPRISNYDDFDPLEENGAQLRYITRPFEMGDPTLIILPGTKSTYADLKFLWQSGLAASIIARSKSGTPVIGICGGYQMLGRAIHDPDKVETDMGDALGLGLLDTETTFIAKKSTNQVKGRVEADYGLLTGLSGQEITGYEIHMGQTEVKGSSGAFRITETPKGATDYADGAINAEGTVFGTYIHGIFHNNGFLRGLLNALHRHHGLPETTGEGCVDRDKEYDKLAELIRSSCDIKHIYKIIEEGI